MVIPLKLPNQFLAQTKKKLFIRKYDDDISYAIIMNIFISFNDGLLDQKDERKKIESFSATNEKKKYKRQTREKKNTTI